MLGVFLLLFGACQRIFFNLTIVERPNCRIARSLNQTVGALSNHIKLPNKVAAKWWSGKVDVSPVQTWLRQPCVACVSPSGSSPHVSGTVVRHKRHMMGKERKSIASESRTKLHTGEWPSAIRFGTLGSGCACKTAQPAHPIRSMVSSEVTSPVAHQICSHCDNFDNPVSAESGISVVFRVDRVQLDLYLHYECAEAWARDFNTFLPAYTKAVGIVRLVRTSAAGA